MINCINCIGDKGVESDKSVCREYSHLLDCVIVVSRGQVQRLYNLVPECHVTLGAKKSRERGNRVNSVLKKQNKLAFF